MPDEVWSVLPGALVRLASARIGLMSMDGTAPITTGSLAFDDDSVTLDLEIALDQVKANLLLQTAARSLVRQHGATRLVFQARGARVDGPMTVTGTAQAGDVLVPMTLTIERIGVEARIFGTANLGQVDLPLPGVGRIDDFSFAVDTRVTLARA